MWSEKILSHMRKKIKLLRKNFKFCERKILVDCCARKSYHSLLGKTGDERLYPTQKIRAISRMIKTMSTLFQNQQSTPVGV